MRVVCVLLEIFVLLVLARVILEWVRVPDEHPVGRVRGLLRRITQPLLAPVRALIPPVRLGSVAVDLSPVVVILVLQLLAGWIC